MAAMTETVGMTEQQAMKSGRACFYSAAHNAWFFKGETPPEVFAQETPLKPIAAKSTKAKAKPTKETDAKPPLPDEPDPLTR